MYINIPKNKCFFLDLNRDINPLEYYMLTKNKYNIYNKEKNYN